MRHRRSSALPQEITDFALALPRLSVEEEKTATRDKLVLHNLWIPRWGAIKLQRKTRAWKADHWDVFQEGVVGLFRATETWEPERGIRFSTYGINWVLQRQRRFLNQHSMVRIPEYQVKGDPKDWNDRTKRAFGVISETTTDDERRSLFEGLSSPEEDDSGFGFDEVERLRLAWGVVPKRHRSVLARRVLQSEKLNSIGQTLGVSRARVQQIQEAATRKLRSSYDLLSVAGAR